MIKGSFIMENDAEFWNQRGLEYLDKHEYKEAVWSLSNAIKKNPNLSTAWFRLGVAYTQRQDHDNAIASHIQAWKINPELNGIEEYIIDCYDRVLEQNSKNYKVWWKIGDFFHDKGVYDKSIECYDRTLDLARLKKVSRKLNQVYSNKGIAHYFKGELDFALRCFEEAIKIDINDRDALRHKIMLQKQLKSKKKCSKCGAPLDFKLGQKVGKICTLVDNDHLRFLVEIANKAIDPSPSYDSGKLNKIEDIYKKTLNDVM